MLFNHLTLFTKNYKSFFNRDFEKFCLKSTYSLFSGIPSFVIWKFQSLSSKDSLFVWRFLLSIDCTLSTLPHLNNSFLKYSIFRVVFEKIAIIGHLKDPLDKSPIHAADSNILSMAFSLIYWLEIRSFNNR